MNIIRSTAKTLFILCLPLLLLSTSIGWAVNSLWLYEYGFAKYGISQTTGLAPAELDRAARGLISYFNSDEEIVNITVTKDGKAFALFNEREAVHLRDVKGLFWLDYRIMLGTSVFALGYALVSLFWWKDRRRLARGLISSSILTMGIILLLGIGIAFDFDQLFLQFHLISFSNDMWMLDPSRDYLIMLFPGGFWFDVALFCVLAAAAMALVLGGAGWYLKSREKAETQ